MADGHDHLLQMAQLAASPNAATSTITIGTGLPNVGPGAQLGDVTSTISVNPTITVVVTSAFLTTLTTMITSTVTISQFVGLTTTHNCRVQTSTQCNVVSIPTSTSYTTMFFSTKNGAIDFESPVLSAAVRFALVSGALIAFMLISL